MSALRLQAGGTLDENALYIERPADKQLFQRLCDGEFCYVLAPRQIGKSSLRARIARQLTNEGRRCATVDLTAKGVQDPGVAAFYLGLVVELAEQFGLCDQGFNVAQFWEAEHGLGMTDRFSRFLHHQLAPSLNCPSVVFIDEIDAMLGRPYRDDFFAAIRAVYNLRQDRPALRQLTFCLVGVAQPADLIDDETRTPFNIGSGVALDDFTPVEAERFLPSLTEALGGARALLDEVLSWTDGHPYMTQRLLGDAIQLGVPASEISTLVSSSFLQEGPDSDRNLTFADRHFRRVHKDPRIGQMLQLYRQLLDGERVPTSLRSRVQLALRLTGLVAERSDDRGPCLLPRNRIFTSVFDATWIKEIETERLLAEPLRRWLDAGKSEDTVLRGQELGRAMAWIKRRDDITEEELAFLRTSQLVAAREDAPRSVIPVSSDPDPPDAKPRMRAGGSLSLDNIYVERHADQELFRALLKGEFCHVLAPRQIGKSSLRIRTAYRLLEHGIKCASIDLTTIGGSGTSVEQFYYTLMWELEQVLEPESNRDESDIDSFWQKHQHLPPEYRFWRFLTEEVLSRLHSPLVIFLDEIDALRIFNFGTEFLASLRSVYNQKAAQPAMQRLTFCLLGVAQPRELVGDPERTTFNISRFIELHDFQREELQAFLPAIPEFFGNPQALLDEVFFWTDGHPYMTQRLLMAAIEMPAPTKQLVERLFLREGGLSDPNLSYAEFHIKRFPHAHELLVLYRRMLADEHVVRDRFSTLQSELLLSGLVAERSDERGRFLRPRNRIYATVFGVDWINAREVPTLLSQAHLHWHDSQRNPDLLLRGDVLATAREWVQGPGRRDIVPDEVAFLFASEDAARKEERRRLQRQTIVVALASLMVLTITIVVFLLSWNRVLGRH